MHRFLLVLTILLCSSCHDDPPVVYPTTAPLDVNKLALGPGDKLNLTVFYGSHSFQAAYALDSSGQISVQYLSLIHISEPTRLLSISYAVFCLKKKKKDKNL